MSLIADALKTAQRQKQQRESGRTPSQPLLVAVRAAPKVFPWPRVLLYGASGALVIAAALAIATSRQRQKPPLATLPPVTSPLAGTPLLTATATAPGARSPAQKQLAAPNDSISSASASSATALPSAATGAATQPSTAAVPPATATAPAQTPAVLQSQPGDSAPASPPVSPRSSGRLRIAVDAPPRSSTAHLFDEAVTAHRSGRLAVARPLYEQVLSINPNDADALNNLGVLLSAQREFDRALELLRRAAAVAPSNAGTWNNIGAVLREQGHGSDASAAFRQALTIDPQHNGAKVGLAQQYLATGSPAQARTLLEEVVVANPGLAEAHYALGQALELQGDREGAIRSFNDFVRLAPARLAEHIERVRRHVDSLTTRTP